MGNDATGQSCTSSPSFQASDRRQGADSLLLGPTIFIHEADCQQAAKGAENSAGEGFPSACWCQETAKFLRPGSLRGPKNQAGLVAGELWSPQPQTRRILLRKITKR